MIKEKYIPVKRRQNSVETDRGSCYRKAFYCRILLVEFSDSIDLLKIVSPVRLQELINDFAVCKHCSGTVTCLEAVAQRCSVKKVF